MNEPLTFEFLDGRNPTTRILRLTGPLVLQNIFELQAALAAEHHSLAIFDLSAVPYMDSSGMGVITNYYVSAVRRGQKVIVAGASPRILELFKLTRVDTIIPLAPSVEEAEASA